MASTNDLKNGLVLNLEGQLWSVVEFQHVKPGKGPAFVRTKLRNVESGKNVDKTFNAGTKVETANVDKRTMQYLYNDGSSYVFMDTGTYDQLEVTYTEPGLQGDRSTGGTKPATVETGATVAVPLFITTGEKIKVDTRTSDYLGRVNS